MNRTIFQRDKFFNPDLLAASDLPAETLHIRRTEADQVLDFTAAAGEDYEGKKREGIHDEPICRPPRRRRSLAPSPRRPTLLLLLGLIAGCSSLPREVANMPVFSSPPDQLYVRVSDVFASGDEMDDALKDAKKKAHAVGANAILIKDTKDGSYRVRRGFGGGSLSCDVNLVVEAIRLQK